MNLFSRAEPVIREPVRNNLRQRFPIAPNERVFIAGKTGSGKTQLAKLLLSNYDDVIILDPKCSMSIPGFRIITESKNLSKVKRGENIIFQPPHDWETDEYEAFFKWVYTRRDCVLYIDEIYAVGGERLQPSSWLGAIATRGREFGIGLWVTTQRPVSIPLFLLSECEWIFAFRMRMKNDIKRIQEVAEDENLKLNTLQKYQFICVSSPQDTITGPIKLSLPTTTKAA